MTREQMKRITITLPDQAAAELEDWADQQGRPVANLATFLVELGIRQGKEKGEYTPSGKKQNPDDRSNSTP
jgi:hypothetical protein